MVSREVVRDLIPDLLANGGFDQIGASQKHRPGDDDQPIRRGVGARGQPRFRGGAERRRALEQDRVCGHLRGVGVERGRLQLELLQLREDLGVGSPRSSLVRRPEPLVGDVLDVGLAGAQQLDLALVGVEPDERAPSTD